MQKQTLFFTLICTFALHAADDMILTLQSNDGQYITIARCVAQHSQTLKNLIGDCCINQTVPITNFNTQDLTLLANILNTINTSTSHEDAIRSLRAMIHNTSENPIAALHDFFDILPLRQALAEHFFQAFCLDKTKNILQKATFLKTIYKNLRTSSNDEKADAKTRQNALLILRIIKDMQLTDKENFLTSKGKQIGLFFTGVSVGQAAQHGLINMNYEPIGADISTSPFDPVVNALSDQHVHQTLNFDVRILHYEHTDNYLTSLQGLVCKAPIDIRHKNRTVRIFQTNICHLPAKAFQHTQDPHMLLLNHNKIASIDPEAFQGLNSLKTLYLCNNHITDIPLEVFKPLINLEVLSLSANYIRHLSADMFTQCKKLKTLFLLDTFMTAQKIHLLRSALPHVTIYASFNPLVASNYSLINS